MLLFIFPEADRFSLGTVEDLHKACKGTNRLEPYNYVTVWTIDVVKTAFLGFCYHGLR